MLLRRRARSERAQIAPLAGLGIHFSPATLQEPVRLCPAPVQDWFGSAPPLLASRSPNWSLPAAQVPLRAPPACDLARAQSSRAALPRLSARLSRMRSSRPLELLPPVPSRNPCL